MLVGSIKTNAGHLEPTADIAGFIRACNAFDAMAEGFERSVGCGVLVPKRLSQANLVTPV